MAVKWIPALCVFTLLPSCCSSASGVRDGVGAPPLPPPHHSLAGKHGDGLASSQTVLRTVEQSHRAQSPNCCFVTLYWQGVPTSVGECVCVGAWELQIYVSRLGIKRIKQLRLHQHLMLISRQKISCENQSHWNLFTNWELRGNQLTVFVTKKQETMRQMDHFSSFFLLLMSTLRSQRDPTALGGRWFNFHSNWSGLSLTL